MSTSSRSTQKIATIFGGTGFIGRYIVRDLARAGYLVKVASRLPESAYFLRPYGVVGQVVPVPCRADQQDSIDNAVKGADLVVNCVGVLYERRRGDFRRFHVDFAQSVAASCARQGVSRLVHLSALGCDTAQSNYAKTKRDGEAAVLAAYPAASLLRPAVVFGPEDRFFNLFAGLARFFPVLPLIGGKTRMQPVYVGDVAKAVMAAATLPMQGLDTPQGTVYEIGGPDVFTMREIYQNIFNWTGRPRLLLPLPFALAAMKAAVLQLIPPRPLLTPDQVKTLKTDCVVKDHAPGLETLGVAPVSVHQVVPGYMERFRSGGRFSDRKTA